MPKHATAQAPRKPADFLINIMSVSIDPMGARPHKPIRRITALYRHEYSAIARVHNPKGRSGRNSLHMIAKRFPAFVCGLFVVATFAFPAIAQDSIAAKVQICGSCHGESGTPSDPTIPILWGQRQAYLEKQLRDYKSGDRDSQIMSSMVEGIRNEDVSGVAAFFAGRSWPRHGDGSVTGSPPDAIAACQTCHQENLLGGAAPNGPAPRLAGQTRAYLVDTMRSFANGERGNSADMSTLMKGVTTADREAIASYLSGL
jgi:cytochrome c553